MSDWDLMAVVRSCSTSVKNTSPPIGEPLPLPNFSPPLSHFQNPVDPNPPFTFPNLYPPPYYSGFDELQHALIPATKTKTTTTTPISLTNIVSSNFSVGGGFGGHMQPQIHHHTPNQRYHQPQPNQYQQQRLDRQHPQPQQGFQKPKTSPTLKLRTRRRKDLHSRKVVLSVAALTDDSYSWRKYGQKPIKGSPYPRSYYRCSTCRGCGAKKYVERNSADPNTFVVSYTGSHVGDRLTAQRLSVANTSRKKSNIYRQPPSFPLPSNLSPTTPLIDFKVDDHKTMDEQEDINVEDEMPDYNFDFDFNFDDDDETFSLIPNLTMGYDTIMSFQELHAGGTQPSLSIPSSSIATTAQVQA